MKLLASAVQKKSELLAFMMAAALTPFAAHAKPTAEPSPTPKSQLEHYCKELEKLIASRTTMSAEIKSLELELQKSAYPKIPLRDDFEITREQLFKSAKDHGLTLRNVKVSGRDAMDKPLPRSVFVEDNFKFRESQLIEVLHLQIWFKGDKQRAEDWAQHWKKDISRLLRLDTPNAYVELAPDSTLINAIAYRFRDIRHPPIQFKDPILLVPPSESKNPQLAKLVSRGRELRSKASLSYNDLERLKLAQARLEHYRRLVR